jgi:hypothetical protein
MVTECPHCKKEMNVRDEYLGRECKCPKCGDSFVVTDSGNSEAISAFTEASNSMSTLVIVALIAAVLAGAAGFGSGMILNRPKLAQQQSKIDAVVNEAVSPLQAENAGLKKQNQSLSKKLSQLDTAKRRAERRTAMQTQVAKKAVQAKRTIQAEANRKADAAEKQARDLLEKTEKPSPPITVRRPHKKATTGITRLAVGEYGLVKRVSVTQIIDDNNAIVSIRLYRKERILTAAQARAIEKSLTKTIWLKGVSTVNYADGSGIQLNTTCEITGTKSYTTAFGSQKTLFVMEPVK